MAKKSVDEFIVFENRPLNNSNFLLKLQAPAPLPAIQPGQFVNIDIPDCSEIFLRRPFSVFNVDYDDNSISIIVKILGRGSEKLTKIKNGETLNLIYPLGTGFTYPDKNDKILLVGGGSGIAPMLFLASECRLEAENVDIIIGARTNEDHINIDKYRSCGKFHFTTEDGSSEIKGVVTDHPVFIEKLKIFDKIYACGPLAMMKAVAKEAKRENIFCEVSLENMMACGFGVCLCCIEPTVKGNLCVCTEGPVFNINQLKWQI